MNYLKTLLIFILLLIVSFAVHGMAFSQDPGTTVEVVTAGDWDSLLAAIGGFRGAGTMGLIVAIIQGLLLALKSPIGALAGPYKLLLIAALTMALGVTGLKIDGFDWQTALMHSTTLVSFQVLVHQIWKQMLEAKNKTV